MTTENLFAKNLKYLRTKRGMEQIELANLLNRKSSSSISEWEKGKYTPKAGVLNDIAKIFNVSLSELMESDIEQNISFSNKQSEPYYALTPKDERDIAKELEEMIAELSNNGGSLAFSKEDEEFDEETRELLIASLEQSLRIAKMEAKKRFTPKKYRN